MSTTRIRSLAELPTEMSPGRDLWPAIAGRIEPADGRPGGGAVQGRRAPGRLSLLALAASVALVALGVWLGRASLPGAVPAAPAASSATLAAAFMPDKRFLSERAALRRQAETRLASLSPEARARTLASLETLDRALREIRAALGQDPANALLQELLVNTYQDEMRVLTELQTAGNGGQET